MPLTVRAFNLLQGGKARRPAFLRQGSDANLDARDALPTAQDKTQEAPQPVGPQPLGSWAGRQTALPLPTKPTGFPAPSTKVGFVL